MTLEAYPSQFPWPPNQTIKIECSDRILGEGTEKRTYLGKALFNYPQNVVIKQLRAYSQPNLENSVNLAKCAQQMAEKWNRINSYIQINFAQPIIKENLLIEPYIGEFTKFNDNNGNTNGDQIDAFTHFTFHESGGEYIICDLQGVKSSTFFPTIYKLSDPAVCSKNQSMGSTDTGSDGINSFFKEHKCTVFCMQYSKPNSVFPSNVNPQMRIREGDPNSLNNTIFCSIM